MRTFNEIALGRSPSRIPQINYMPQALVPIIAATTGLAATSFAVQAIAYIAFTAATSIVLSALAPKPDMSNLQGMQANQRSAVTSRDYIYGQVRKGGTITYMESTGASNRYMHMVLVLAGHELTEIGDIYINDEVVTLDGSGFVTGDTWKSKVRIKKHLGDQTTADADLLAESEQIDSTFVGRGCAYLYVRLEYDSDVFANGIPLFTAIVKGAKVYDPRTATTAYSNNPALCIRHYLTSAYGLGDTSSEIDDVAFAAAANVCDEDITLAAGGTQKQYEMNGVVSASMTFGDALSKMLSACAGTLFWGGGKWQLKPGYYSTPTASFTLDDLRGPISGSPRANMRDSFNSVRGKFNDADQDWITVDYPEIASTVFLAEDNGFKQPLDLELPFTTSSPMAQRLAKITLYRARDAITFSADFGLSALSTQIGDTVALTIDRYGWSEKTFEVTGWKFYANQDAGDLRVNLVLREISASSFDWDADETEIISNNTNLLKFNQVPNVGVNAFATTRVLNEKVTNFILVTVTASEFEQSQVDYAEVQFRQSDNGDYKTLGTGQLGGFEAVDLDNGFYDFRARAVNGFGYYGQWEYLTNVEATSNLSAPDSVADFAGDINNQTVTLTWLPLANPDLSYYKLRHAIEETGAVWANATTAIEKIARPSTTVSLPIRAGTYMIRAYDKEAKQSESVANVIIPAELMPVFASTDLVDDATTFPGTKTGCSIDSGRLIITDPSTAPSSATYEFSDIIDRGSVGRSYCRIRCGTLRLDNSAGLWDSIPGLWDSWPGLWDDWTGFSQFDDTNVLFYIATSNDAPGSPTWSDWQLFRAGDFYARLFKFKIVLKSSTANVTPSVGALEAIVEWN